MPSGGSTPIDRGEVVVLWRQLVSSFVTPMATYAFLQPLSPSLFVTVQDIKWVRECALDSMAWGLQVEWMQWFVGGMRIDGKRPAEAAIDACTEWDF